MLSQNPMRNSGIWTTVTSIDRHDYLNFHRSLLTYVDFGFEEEEEEENQLKKAMMQYISLK